MTTVVAVLAHVLLAIGIVGEVLTVALTAGSDPSVLPVRTADVPLAVLIVGSGWILAGSDRGSPSIGCCWRSACSARRRARHPRERPRWPGRIPPVRGDRSERARIDPAMSLSLFAMELRVRCKSAPVTKWNVGHRSEYSPSIGTAGAAPRRAANASWVQPDAVHE